MNPYTLNRPWSTHLWISIGAGLFLVALTGSALVVPELRLLHLLQALIYVAVVILAPQQCLRTGRGLHHRSCLELNRDLRAPPHAGGCSHLVVISAYR
jgi:hypothetical protein